MLERFISWLISLFGGTVVTKPSLPVDPPPLTEVIDLLDYHNVTRKTSQLPPFRLDKRLTVAAQAHADWMAYHQTLSHLEEPPGSERSYAPSIADRAQKAGYANRLIAENIAAGQTTPAEVMQSWLHSYWHALNITDPRLIDIGAGIAVSSTGKRYWCVVFAGT